VALKELITAVELNAAVVRLGAELSVAYPGGALLVGVLKGSVPFLSDVVRAMAVPTEIDFLAISSYAEGTGRVRIVKDLEADICGRDVVLVEDIVDTGLTLNYLLGELRRRGPASLEACALIDRPARRIVPASLAYVGFTIPDEYVIGYGLDFSGRYRNLPMLYAADVIALDRDPDAYVEQVFGD
jgi:hypoxanthine phosphoribosyltransferase